MTQKLKKITISPRTGWFDINFRELLAYKDLIRMFVKRSFASQYKQTILGPLWFIINPLITTLLFTFVFGGIAKISTDGVPQFLFYLAGNSIWSYFALCLTSTSNTFTANSAIFGKVYFPRLTMPIATVIFSGISLLVQLCLLAIFICYNIVIGSPVVVNISILMLPIWIIQLACLGLGFGIIISSLTTKYRDLTILVTFGVQLWMYLSPVVYPVSSLSGLYKFLIMLNPVAPIINNFRYAALGCGEMEWGFWIVSLISTIVILLLGVILFSKVEKTFMDTV
jgi:lipopolysaccharide transport system permease protein